MPLQKIGSNAHKSRDCLKVDLKKSASASDLKVSAIGHAHIDTGWLWPVRGNRMKNC